jgi:hypothetical protein
MRFTAFLVFSGIALTAFPAFAAGTSNAAVRPIASNTLCPQLEGYPDCPLSEEVARAFYPGAAPVRAAFPRAKSHRGLKPGSTSK